MPDVKQFAENLRRLDQFMAHLSHSNPPHFSFAPTASPASLACI